MLAVSANKFEDDQQHLNQIAHCVYPITTIQIALLFAIHLTILSHVAKVT